MILTKDMIEEINRTNQWDSDSFTKLSFYRPLMDSLDKEYSNDDLKALAYLLTELGRNVEYSVMRQRASIEYEVTVDVIRQNRMNHIEFTPVRLNYLLLGDGKHQLLSFNNEFGNAKVIPFYKYNYQMVAPIYDELERLDKIYHIVNKDEAIGKITELTGCERRSLNVNG